MARIRIDDLVKARAKIAEAQELIAPWTNRPPLAIQDARGFLDFAGDRLDVVIQDDRQQYVNSPRAEVVAS